MTQEEYIEKYGEEEGRKRWKKYEQLQRWKAENPDKVKEQKRRHYAVNKEKVCEHKRQYYVANREQIKERERQRREANPDYDRQHYRANKEYYRQWAQANKDKVNESNRRWAQAHPMEHRANVLLQSYRNADRKYHRGECTLTSNWILTHIFTNHCLYCGETDWRKLGCDRKNNNRPHTVGNVVCSCRRCNEKRQKLDIITYALSIGAVESEGLTI